MNEAHQIRVQAQTMEFLLDTLGTLAIEVARRISPHSPWKRGATEAGYFLRASARFVGAFGSRVAESYEDPTVDDNNTTCNRWRSAPSPVLAITCAAEETG